jgi:tetratricopeptide (TPR) repeat protein
MSRGALARRAVTLLLLLGMVGAGTGCDDIRARKLVKEGNDLYRKGEFQEAIKLYDEAALLKPDLAKVYVNRAYAYQQMFAPGDTSKQNMERAEGLITSVKKAREFQPEREDLRNLLIQVWIDAKKYDDALAFFKLILDKDPKNLEAIQTIGVIYSKWGKFDEALTWYKKRTEIQPNHPEAFYAVGTLIWEKLHADSQNGPDKLTIPKPERLKLCDDAIAQLKKSLELNPKYIDAMTYMNLTLREKAISEESLEKGQVDVKEADEWMKKALELQKQAAAAKPAEPAKKK